MNERGALWNDPERDTAKYLMESLFQCHLSTLNPTWNDLGLNRASEITERYPFPVISCTL